MHRVIQLTKFFTIFIFFALQAFADKQPNIVFIMADDLGGRDLPCYGNKFNEAPHLDKLAKQGMTFDHAYAAPVCSATRASIQSGQYPARVGIFDFITGHWRPYEKVIVPIHKVQHLPNNIETVGDALQKAGYKTGYFGKWHLGNSKEHLPSARGYGKTHMYAGGGFDRPRFIPAYKNKDNKRLSDVLTDMSVDFIKENKDQPFFLFLSHYDVHVQLDADKDLIDKYLKKKRAPDYASNAVYAAMVEHTDKSVGGIMKALDELNLADNTLFIFYSDNGGVDNRFDNIPLLGGKSRDVYPKDHPLRYIATSNAPLRAGKGTLYEGGIRVPLIVRWPKKVSANTRSDAIVHSVDLYPTFIELAKGKAPKSQVLDGHSMLPALTENKYDLEREVFTHYPVFHHEQPMSALRKGDWKIVENLINNTSELYNLKYDVNEMTDLRFSHKEKYEQMKSLLKEWQTKTQAQFPKPNPNFDEAKRWTWGRHPDRVKRK